jgi:hypothetical protein
MRRSILISALCAVAASAVLACGDDVVRMAGRVMVDAGKRLQQVDASVLDASAQSSSADGSVKSQCGTCVVSGPITILEPIKISDPIKVQDPIKIMTADTDPLQLVGGSARLSGEWKELAKGPLVLTDMMYTGDDGQQGAATFAVDSPGKCSATSEVLAYLASDRQTNVQGARLLIAQGKVLCGSTNFSLHWSGFRSYE